MSYDYTGWNELTPEAPEADRHEKKLSYGW